MADRELNLFIRAKDRATGVFRKFTDFVKSRFVITLGDAVRALRGLSEAFLGVIEAANKEELSIKKRDEALRQTNQLTEEASRKLDEHAAALQKVTIFGDETIREVQALLIQFGKLSTDQVPAATKAVLGLATAQGMDLKASALLVAKSLGSTTNALTRYGIEIDNSLRGTARFNALIGGMAPLFGSATAEAETFAGRIKQIGNAWGDQLELIGLALTKNQALLDSLESLKKTLEDPRLVEGIAALASGLAKIAGASVEAAAVTGRAFGDVSDVIKNIVTIIEFQLNEQVGTFQRLMTQIGEQAARNRGLLEQQQDVFKDGKLTLDEITAALADKTEKDRTAAVEEQKGAAATATKNAQLLSQLKLTETLTEKINLLVAAGRLQKGIEEDTAEKLKAAADALGIQIDAADKLADEEAAAGLFKHFEALQELNAAGIISDQKLLEARLNLEEKIGRETLARLEATKESIEAAAESGAVAIGDLEAAVGELREKFGVEATESGRRIGAGIGAGVDTAIGHLERVRVKIEEVKRTAASVTVNVSIPVQIGQVGQSPASSNKGRNQSSYSRNLSTLVPGPGGSQN